MNFIEIAGFLGADAEERFTSTGKRVVSLRVATKTRKAGKDETLWWRVNIWGDRFDRLIPYLKKGSSVIIFGEMDKPEVYTDKNGTPQISLSLTAEIIKFSPFGKPDREGGAGAPSVAAEPPQQMGEEMAGYGASSKRYGELEETFAGDDLPF